MSFQARKALLFPPIAPKFATFRFAPPRNPLLKKSAAFLKRCRSARFANSRRSLGRWTLNELLRARAPPFWMTLFHEYCFDRIPGAGFSPRQLFAGGLGVARVQARERAALAIWLEIGQQRRIRALACGFRWLRKPQKLQRQRHFPTNHAALDQRDLGRNALAALFWA